MESKRLALYPGSFDPVTLVHVDMIRRISLQYDQIIVLIAENPAKASLFTVEERKQMLRAELKAFGNVKVESFHGLTIDFAHEVGARTIVRGLRAVSDFEYEFAMANMNHHLASDIETVLMFTSPKYNFISSRLVKEVARFGGDLKEVVPASVVQHLKNKFNS
ncbi:MAG: pantetheine-phosphate adenylyltransferase [Bdellovibrionales bacterium]|nr:pantetheine-phosphate adenylyltransferase [Bdellovibrionales bacterium]